MTTGSPEAYRRLPRGILPLLLLAAVTFARPALAQHATPMRFARVPAAEFREAAADTIPALEPPRASLGTRVAFGAVSGAVIGGTVLWVISYSLHDSTCQAGTCGSNWQDRGPRDSAIGGALAGAVIGAFMAWVTAPRS